MTRWGVMDDPEAAFETLGGWLAAHGSGLGERHEISNAKKVDYAALSHLAKVWQWGREQVGATGL
jgi:nitric oxide reductase subunit C